MAAYPFMFPAEIYEIWHKKIYKMKPNKIAADLNNLHLDCKIPKEFVEKVTAEYDRRVTRYNEMFGESPHDNKKG
jgi:nitrate/TMAO reductase-like tetraheme cytochrome c subunit